MAVPVSIPAGAQRRCDIKGTATLMLNDGMDLTATGDQAVCLVDPVPGNPNLPRLDMQVLGSPIVNVHAGDQAAVVVRITNNDPTRSFTGSLDVSMVSSARLPGASGPMPPGTGVYSVSDPVQGDNFPIAFTEGLVDGCVELPDDPHDPAIPTIVKAIPLEPGESIEVVFYVRPWGMCGNGSCGEGTIELRGTFSDGSDGLACAGVAVAVDTSVPPGYGWPDAGQVAQVTPGILGDALTLEGEPTPGDPRPVALQAVEAVLEVDGVPWPSPPAFVSDNVDPERGRIRAEWDGDFVDAASSIDLHFAYRGIGPAGTDEQWSAAVVLDGAPTGFADVAPVVMALLGLGPDGGPVDAYLELMQQSHVVGIDEIGQRREISFADAVASLTPDGFEVWLTGGTVAPGESPLLVGFESDQDFRGFFSEVPQTELGSLFTDGFESGNTVRWSTTVP